MALLRELQDKARNVLAETRASADPTLLHLIEELCRVGERIKEESTREKQDLLLQVRFSMYFFLFLLWTKHTYYWQFGIIPVETVSLNLRLSKIQHT